MSPDNAHERHVAAFLDSLPEEPLVEQPAILPLSVGDRRVTISRFVDLVHVTPARVEIADYKADHTRRVVPEYTVQLSVYYRVLESAFPDRPVETSLFFTEDGERIPIDPLSVAAIAERVKSIWTDNRAPFL